jgi:Fe-S oxidoreductase
MGWLPTLARRAARAPRVVNAVSGAPLVRGLAKRLAGVDHRRQLPRFADEPFTDWWRARPGPTGDGRLGPVVLWPDTFTNYFHPSVARAAVSVLEAAGWSIIVPEGAQCCGLTWISTGQLDVAKRVLRRTATALAPHLREGRRVLVLEPSCAAVFRSDAPDLLAQDQDILRLRDQTVTLAELLVQRTPGWQPPHVGRRVVVQTHCHHHAVLGTDCDRELLERTGCDLDVLDSGCCGLAGNFGFERGHYDVSVACAERVLLPAVRAAGPRDVVLADGFSCRTQLDQTDGGGRRGVHLAELLAGAAHDDGAPWPEARWRGP